MDDHFVDVNKMVGIVRAGVVIRLRMADFASRPKRSGWDMAIGMWVGGKRRIFPQILESPP